jgi:hypothetical protein
MALTDVQKGVARGAIAAIALTIAGLGLAILLPTSKLDHIGLAGRFALCAASLLAPALTLAFSIARLASYRFSSPEDIAGSGLSSGSDRARLLQSLLQNTLEQSVLAVAAYLAWSVLAPAGFLAALPMAAGLFLVARSLFFVGYRRGAAGRALGFALTFYPTLALLLGDLCFAALKLIAWLRVG